MESEHLLAQQILAVWKLLRSMKKTTAFILKEATGSLFRVTMAWEYCLGNLKFCVLKQKQFHKILYSLRTEKAINQGKFRIHWWVHQRDRYSKM